MLNHVRSMFVVVGALVLISSTTLQAQENNVSQSVNIMAPAAKVWEIVGNFSKAEAWLPMVKSTTANDSNEPGAKRELVLGEGIIVYETLEMWDGKAMSLGYVIPDETHDPTILPVKGYSSTIDVLELGADETRVTWSSKFVAPDGMADADAVGPVEGLYRASLDNLKAILEN